MFAGFCSLISFRHIDGIFVSSKSLSSFWVSEEVKNRMLHSVSRYLTVWAQKLESRLFLAKNNPSERLSGKMVNILPQAAIKHCSIWSSFEPMSKHFKYFLFLCFVDFMDGICIESRCCGTFMWWESAAYENEIFGNKSLVSNWKHLFHQLVLRSINAQTFVGIFVGCQGKECFKIWNHFY